MMFKKRKENCLHMNVDEVIGITTVKTNSQEKTGKLLTIKEDEDDKIVVAVVIKVNDDFEGDYYKDFSSTFHSLQFRTKIVYSNKKDELFIRQNGRKKVLSHQTVKDIKKRVKKLKRKMG